MENQNEGPWGFHLVLDITGCDIEAATNPNIIKTFCEQLVKDIDMIPFGDPMIVHFCDGDKKAGWTLVQLIQTSNIMAHFIDMNGDCFMDIFSCKQFDKDTALECINKYFRPKYIKVHPVFVRKAS